LETTNDAISAAMVRASTRYTRLVLLIGPEGTGKSSGLRAVGDSTGNSVTNVGLQLAPLVTDVPVRRRPVAAADGFGDLVRGSGSGDLLLLDNLELLFLPELRLDPLKLLQDSARNRVVVAAWSGSVVAGELRYAAPSHPEFRTYREPDCVLVDLTGAPRGIS
jgi:hypothetical protein